MRVVYLNPCGNLGGAETSLLELLAGVRAAAPALELWLVLGGDGPVAEQARQLGVSVLVEPFPPALAQLGDSGSGRLRALAKLLIAGGACIAYKARLDRILRTIQPDLIHSNGFKMHLLAAFSKARRAAVVWHIHDYVSTRRLMAPVLRLCRSRCNAAIVNSKSVAKDVESLLPGLDIVPIYNAVDLKRFSPNGVSVNLDALSGLAPAPVGTIRVGLVATFARWKGHKVFLRALARLSSKLPVRGYIIGGPIYQTVGSQWSRNELDGEAARLGLAGKVGFTGFLSDTAAAMRSLDIVVHASTEPEPFGMVIIEGMACGKPVIASQAGGATELFEDGETALAHPPGDDAMLAEQILRLANEPDLREKLSKQGRRAAEGQYHRERLAQELLTVYRRVSSAPVQLAPAVDVGASGELVEN